MYRRFEFQIAAFLATLALTTPLLPGQSGQVTGAGERPNLLLITIDTLRADRLGSYGYAQARTPVLDQLAREGVRFERAFSPVPLTLPAHASLLTGTYPTYHGVHDNSGYRLAPEHITLAEVLKSAGYDTGAFVGAYVLDSRFGLGQGFDTYVDDFDLPQNGAVSPGYVQRGGGEVIKTALPWLLKRGNLPFFAWVHLFDPHDPYTPPPAYREGFPHPYDGEIAFTDAVIGQLLNGLRSAGKFEDTLIAVAADHGEGLGEHLESTHGFFLYNATLHVPLILRFPGGEPGGRTVSQNVSLVDLMPTLLQSLRIDRKLVPEVQGTGLLSLLLGRNPNYQPKIYAETYYPRLHFGWSELRALITGSHKFILAPQPELFDLGTDFRETQNLGDTQKVLSNRLGQDLQQVMTRLSPRSDGKSARMRADAEVADKLRSLGYITFAPEQITAGDYLSRPDPKSRINLYNRLTHLFELIEKKQYQTVIPQMTSVLSHEPDLKLVRYKLAQCYFETGRFALALQEFQTLLSSGGQAELLSFDLGQTLMRLNRLEEAASAFRTALLTDPHHVRARTNLGVIYRSQGRLDQAISELEEARRLSPQSVIVLSNLGVSYSLAGRHSEAENALREAILIQPQNAFLYANLGVIYQRMGRNNEAQQQFETARRLNPSVLTPR